MDLVATKIVVLVLLGAIRLVFGLLPLKITKRLQLWGEQPTASHLLVERRRAKIEKWISLCLCFGGGVLLATCFIHMLPEARESLEAVRRDPNGALPSSSSFPFAELFICVGFFLVYIIEEVAHRLFLQHSDPSTATGASMKLTAPAKGPPASAPAAPEKLPPSPPPHAVPVAVSPPPTAVASAPPQCCATVEAELSKMEATPPAANGDAEKGVGWSRPRSTSKIAPATSQVHLLASTLSLEQKDPNGLPLATTVHHHHHAHHHPHHLGHHHHHHHHHLHHHHHVPPAEEKTMMGHVRSVMVVLALSFHSVFEGLAIGLQPTPRDVWYLFTAVSIHASAILFCVGLELATSGMRLLTMLAYVGVLAVVSPLGVALGVAVTSAGGDGAASPAQTLAVGALQGVAGGTILYITFFEVLDREKRREDSAGPLRLACVLAGFAVMVGLQVIGGHDHGGEDGHGLDIANDTHGEALHSHGHSHSPL